MSLGCQDFIVKASCGILLGQQFQM
jgi:hypothetical protein